MNRKLFHSPVIGLVLTAIVLLVSACAQEGEYLFYPNTDLNSTISVNQGVTVVRFASDEAANYVLAAHPISNYDSRNKQFVCDERFYHLTHTTDNEWFGYPERIVNFLQADLQLLQHAPYIPLGEGFYLIDWRWQTLLPLSAIAYDAPDEQSLQQWIDRHCTLAPTQWKDLESLSSTWQIPQQKVPVKELWRISYAVLDQYAGKSNAHQSIYYSGMKPEYIYHQYASVSQYDSLQVTFQQDLLPFIHSLPSSGTANSLSSGKGWSKIAWE